MVFNIVVTDVGDGAVKGKKNFNAHPLCGRWWGKKVGHYNIWVEK